MTTISFRTINFQKVATKIVTGEGFELDLLKKQEKGSLEKILKKQEKKHKKGHAKFYSIKGTCPCCMKEFTINKKTGKLSNHYMEGQKCLGAGLEPLEISDEGLLNTIQTLISLWKTYNMLAKKAHKWSNAKKENEAKAASVKEILLEKIALLVSYRDLAKIRRKEEEKASKEAAKKAARAAARAHRAAERAAKKAEKEEKKAAEAAEKKTEKYIVRQAFFANRCKGTFCPKCNKVASTEDEVEIFFGFRKKKDGTLHPQSQCKACRAAANRIARAKKKAAKEAQVA